MVRTIIVAALLGLLLLIAYIINYLNNKFPGGYKNDNVKANKVKDNAKEIQPLVIEAKKKNLFENTELHELRKQARAMNPPPASGMAISGANKDTLINWLNDIGKLDGQGTLTYSDGRKYVGEFKNGKRNGQGILTYSDGRKYVGEFKNDKWIGQVTLTFPDGKKYVSEFKQGPETEITEIEDDIVEVGEEKESEKERLIMIREEKIKKRIELRKMKELES